MSAESKMKPPLLYPCGSGVNMLQVGADTTKLKTCKLRSSFPPPSTQKVASSQPPPGYVKKISSDLNFSEDVVKERCYHLLPYSDKYLYEALDASDVVPTPPKSRVLVGRHNAHGTDRRHMPCHIEKTVAHRLKPIKRRILLKSSQMKQQELDKAAKAKHEEERPLTQSQEMDSLFLTEIKGLNKPPQAPQEEWDAYLMSILSQTTAEWIIKQRTEAGQQKDKLLDALEDRYGHTEECSELIRDDISEGESVVMENAKQKKKKGKWKKGDETLLDKVREITLKQGKPTDPYADDNAAAFYRLPAGFRKAKKKQEKEEADEYSEGAINTTAYNIEVEPYEPPPQPTLRDFMNPAITTTMHQTDNAFEQEWLTGGTRSHKVTGKVKREEPGKITMGSNNKYQKVLQSETPRRPEEWFPPKDDEAEGKQSAGNGGLKKYERGLQRWKSLPKPVNHERGTMLPPMDDNGRLNSQDMEKHLIPPGSDTFATKKPDVLGRKQVRGNNLLIEVVNDWRSKWNLDMRYADATPDDLIRDMADLHPHIRLKAITTCARAAEYVPPPDMGIQLDGESQNEKSSKFLPEELFVALECCLEDNNDTVQRAAAISLYSLERPVPKAEAILRRSLQNESCVDRWTSAQCLAYYGECDSEVVGELVWQLLNTEETVRNEQASRLLARLSENSTLVHSMIAEQLNSRSWRHRVMACKVLPRLHGQINRDLVNKLSHLMWHDFHSEVRKAATQTLGKTGHGKDVHDELRMKILNGQERERQEAVSKVGQLGIMTAKLLPAFLDCFDDSYVSVRMEVCIACTNLRIHEEQVLEGLVQLATFDPIWKVKALALQALGVIGVLTSDIRECVLWAFRYEDQPGVRAQACHTLVVMEMKDDEVAEILQDRYLVETSSVVKQQIIIALEMFGICPTEDMDMVAQVKNEVRKLCTRNNICAQISINDAEDDKQDNIRRMIYRSADEQKTDKESAEKRKSETPSERSSRKPTILVTSEPSRAASSRPYSRETTLTAAVERELESILGREDSYISEAESRPETAHSKKSLKTDERSICTEDEEDALEAEALLETPRPKAQMSQILETQEPEEDATASREEEETKKQQQRPRALEEGGQTYVEIGLEGEQSMEASSDVVKLQHLTPQASSLTAEDVPLASSRETSGLESHGDREQSIAASSACEQQTYPAAASKPQSQESSVKQEHTDLQGTPRSSDAETQNLASQTQSPASVPPDDVAETPVTDQGSANNNNNSSRVERPASRDVTSPDLINDKQQTFTDNTDADLLQETQKENSSLNDPTTPMMPSNNTAQIMDEDSQGRDVNSQGHDEHHQTSAQDDAFEENDSNPTNQEENVSSSDESDD